jgi:hypothetical protein
MPALLATFKFTLCQDPLPCKYIITTLHYPTITPRPYVHFIHQILVLSCCWPAGVLPAHG